MPLDVAVPAVAERDQPPFRIGDGWLCAESAGAETGATYQVIGESAAGHGYDRSVPAGLRAHSRRTSARTVIVSSSKKMLSAAGTS